MMGKMNILLKDLTGSKDMTKSKYLTGSKFFVAVVLLFLFFPTCCLFAATVGDIIHSSKETLYSTRNGKSLGEISLSIEVKSLDANQKEFYLIIGEKSGDIIKGKRLWIFNKKISLNEFKRQLKNNDNSLEIKDFREFVAFSENDIKFEIKNWAEITKQSKYAFSTNAALGEEVTLKLHYYTATKDKKKYTLDDDAVITLAFRLPANNKPAGKPETINAAAGGSQAQGGGGGMSEEDQKKKEEEDAKKQAEAERIQRTNDLDVFITVKNKEIASLLNEIEEFANDKKSTVKPFDSLELVVNEIAKKVDYWDKGYTDILLKEEAIQDKFMKFGTDRTIALKMIAEAKQERTGFPSWLLPVGVAAGILMMGFTFIMQIVGRIKAKKQMMKAMKAQGLGLKEKAKEKTKIKDKDKIKEIDTVDINDLYKI